jgi:hypothetical protein
MRTSWSPPALPLGFQITRIESDQPAKVLDFAGLASRSSKSGGRWSRPLPAWAQVAAAVVIFAAGMSVNAVRSSGEPPARIASAPATRPVATRADTQTDDLSVTRAEFARLDARLRAMEHADVSRASYVPGTGAALDYDELRAQLGSLESRVAVSERQNLASFATLARALEANQRDLVASREATQKVNLLEEEVQDHRQVLRTAVVPGLVQRAAFTNGR